MLPPFDYLSTAERVCKNRLRKNPGDKDALWFLGNAYIPYEKYNEARLYLESLYEMTGGTVRLRLLLSRIYYNLKEYDKVVHILENGSILSPTHRERFYLGASLIELKQFEAGIDNLSIYVKYHGNHYSPFAYLGYAYAMQGSYDRAMDSYKTALSLNPNDEELRENVERCAHELSDLKNKN